MSFSVGDAVEYVTGYPQLAPGCIGEVVECPAHPGTDTVRVRFGGVRGLWDFRIPSVSLKAATFPIPADKDPWSETEPRAAIGAPACVDIGPPVGDGSDNTWVCTRRPHRDGHHVSRDAQGKVNARWPQEAPSAERQALRAGMRFVRSQILLGTAGNLMGRAHFTDAGKHVTLQGEPCGDIVWVDLDDAEDPSGHAPKGVEWRPSSFLACFTPVAPTAERPAPAVGMEIVFARRHEETVGGTTYGFQAGSRGTVRVLATLEQFIGIRVGGLPIIYVDDVAFGDLVIPAAEWDARQKKSPEVPCHAHCTINCPYCGKIQQIGHDVKLPYAPIDLSGDFFGPTPQYQFTEAFVAKLAIALFEEDNAGMIARVAGDGCGGIGTAEARQRLVWMSGEAQRKAYMREAAALLRRARELT